MCYYYITLSFNLHLTEQSSIVSLILQRRAESNFIFKFQIFFFLSSPPSDNFHQNHHHHAVLPQFFIHVHIHLGTGASRFHNMLKKREQKVVWSDTFRRSESDKAKNRVCQVLEPKKLMGDRMHYLAAARFRWVLSSPMLAVLLATLVALQFTPVMSVGGSVSHSFQLA